MTMYEKFLSLNIDGGLISLERADSSFADYFCYPTNAKAIGFECCIMYCFIEGYGETVFACNPESCADIYVYPLARDFGDFMRLILACGSASHAEQIIWMSERQFEQHLREEKELPPSRRSFCALCQGSLTLLLWKIPLNMYGDCRRALITARYNTTTNITTLRVSGDSLPREVKNGRCFQEAL